MLNEFVRYMSVLTNDDTVTIANNNEAFEQGDMVQLITDILDGLKVDYDTHVNDDLTINIDLYE
ncbi:hypothetical protein EEL30_22075 [Brevibacillus laterosporus]|uniref:Uncharacterized protein n=1 Tax=Brevibacillus laterosporus TaxID=1465 RepID=A0A518VCK4_BRELA|nr:hypothetical protein EEL30_22075 [Brevibacillus laterosporus]